MALDAHGHCPASAVKEAGFSGGWGWPRAPVGGWRAIHQGLKPGEGPPGRPQSLAR